MTFPDIDTTQQQSPAALTRQKRQLADQAIAQAAAAQWGESAATKPTPTKNFEPIARLTIMYMGSTKPTGTLISATGRWSMK